MTTVTTTQELIDWCSDELIMLHEMPVRQTPEHIRRHVDMALRYIAIRARLEAAEKMAEAIQYENYIPPKQQQALSAWEDLDQKHDDRGSKELC